MKNTKSEQARINGAKSHGPVTPEGKAKSSRNGIRHGLTAEYNTLLRNECPEQFREVHQSYMEAFRPATRLEVRIVQKTSNLCWRTERIAMMDRCFLSMQADTMQEEILDRYELIDDIGILCESWKKSCGGENPYALLGRYLTTLQRQYESSIKLLERLQARRLRHRNGGTDLDEIDYVAPEFKSMPDFESADDTVKDPQPEPIPEPPQPKQPRKQQPKKDRPGIQSEPKPPQAVIAINNLKRPPGR